ncbi:endo alpha-1,4 polygalactosaminidase [Streptantibioticus ferralitis]|uniref:Endo alpha-1,4 polygalactosaminidase n=1 Tax=Streptantibioticus ferralitis TaxID=236510 RepID=A0ABT5YVN1_9ACTN|nr:endo alpha-1,4 polygalactosaminidase [Streptantibioticus ferralitis]MDF2255590.1 endo alpha-1,4 polygalactosaminidase [Streptantibioticus ferralitis]
MTANDTFRARRPWTAAMMAIVAVAAATLSACDPARTNTDKPAGSTESAITTESANATNVKLPPVHAGFDYQIGGPYAPSPGVAIVSRDHTTAPAAGLYSICYVNAFQAQPGAQGQWPADLLLHDPKGQVVIDHDWNEALLDITTSAKRTRVAARIDHWIDECAGKGYNAVEPDNYDSYSRSDGLLTADDAKAFMTLLATHAHARGLAIGQKNTADLAGSKGRTHVDFAVAEECAEYNECGTYASAFADHVVVIEYTDQGLHKACSAFGKRLSIVRRDRDVTTPGDAGYVRKTC